MAVKKALNVSQAAHKTSWTKASSARKTNQAAMDAMGCDTLCDRLRAGETLTSIARSLDLKSVSTLLKWIASDQERSARAREARIAASSMYDEQAQEAIEKAEDPLALAKAKELAHHLRWRASKVDPRNYGDRVQVEGTVDHKVMTDDVLLQRLAKLGVQVDSIVPAGPAEGADAG